MVLRVTGIVLPEREERTLFIDGGVLREDPVPGADRLIDGGWLLPGLVDVHTHPGAEQPGDPFEDTVLRRDLADQAAAGVLLIRAPGSAARIPAWAHDEDGLPRVRSAGPWLATPGRFFPDWGRRITEAELAAASGGWCKIIGDWAQDEPPVPLDVLCASVTAVHAAGGKVAVHSQTAPGCANAVAAGADSLEHGMHLDPALLDQMAAQGTALVPTIGAFAQAAVRVRAQAPSPRRDAFLHGWAALPGIARAAYEAGVTVLAGTDTHPCGTIAQEVERLISAGLPRAAALGAACWTARSWLGLPGLVDGAPADLVVFAEDPVAHPDVLHHPSRIILRGQVVT